MVLINNILQFLGFGWEYRYNKIKAEHKGRLITVIQKYRINKYTNKVYKGKLFAESKFGNRNWIKVKKNA